MTLELKHLLYLLLGLFILTNTITGLTVSYWDMKKQLETEKELAIKTEQLNSINELMQEIDKMKLKKNKYNPTAYHISSAIHDAYQEYPILTAYTHTEIIRLIKKESGFDADAVSVKGAVSIMQLMPATAKAMKVKNIYHPYDNTKGGLKYLAYLLHKYKNKRLALYAYYTGEGNLNWHIRQGRIPDYLHDYVRGII